MHKFLYLLSLISLFTLTGCNTVKGVGQDMQAVGAEIKEAAIKTGASSH